MLIHILIEFSVTDDEDQSIINVFDDEYLANKYLNSLIKNQPNNFYTLKTINTTEEDIQDGNV